MLNFLKILTLFMLIICYSFAAHSDAGRVGVVKKHKDVVTVSRGSVEVSIELNDIVKMGDTIITDDTGSLGIIFSDGGVLTIGPNSNITIREYIFQPVSRKLSFFADVSEGNIIYTSGAMNRIMPGSVNFNTPSGVVTMLGTKVIIEVK